MGDFYDLATGGEDDALGGASSFQIHDYLDDPDGEASELSHIEWALATEARLRDFTGEEPPDLLNRALYLRRDELQTFASAPVDGILGLYQPGSGAILVRDSPEAERQDVLLHEALHAWQVERSGRPLEPVPLTEAITQHFVHISHPEAGREVGAELLEDDQIRVLVPDLERDRIDDGDVVLERAPEIYPSGVAVVEQLEGLVGRGPVFRMYASADHGEMSEVIDEQFGIGSWSRFCSVVADNDWQTAAVVLDSWEEDLRERDAR